ncbi:MAG: helix-hairpin-helix domain-containing protein [Anaeroplasma bactoclasticum]|nr:helix-hairpin-helix domain-containing protein [Anaeroplasma bactoclasticum]
MDKKQQKTEEIKEENIEHIILTIEGEVVRPLQLQYTKAISYGVLFLRIENSLNEFSDLSGFDYEEVIESSKMIYIPTYDVYNNYTPKDKITIHSATLEELQKLPQVGIKRGQKILDYIAEHGHFVSWEEFFEIASVPERVKDEIKKQAVL